MTTVFVYEDVTATWATGDHASLAALSLLTEGRAMRDAIIADFEAIGRAEPRQGLDDATVNSVRVTSGPLTGLLPSSSPDFILLIAPEIEGRLESLARNMVASGNRLLGPSPDAIRLTSDKLALARHWENCGVQTPRTWIASEASASGPIVVKPRDGAGSQGVASGSALEAPASENWIAQELIPGYAASVAFLLGDSACIPLMPCQQLLSNDGRFEYLGGRLPISPPLATRAIAIATAAVRCVPGLLGYVGVDVVLGDDGRDWAIEINPRLTTSYVGLRQMATFNIAEAMLRIVQSRPYPAIDWREETIEFLPDGHWKPIIAASR